MSAGLGGDSAASSSGSPSAQTSQQETTRGRGVARLVSAGTVRSGSSVSFKAEEDELEEETKEVFNLFDKDRRGAIDPKEVRVQMSALGFGADNTTIYQLISDLDSDGSQMLELEEFQGLMNDVLHVNSDEYLSRGNLGEIFEFLDHLDPGQRTSRLELADLRRVANVLGDTISDAELRAMINGADQEGKGFVSCEDFYQMMTLTSHLSSSPSTSSEGEGKDVEDAMESREEEGFLISPKRTQRGSAAAPPPDAATGRAPPQADPPPAGPRPRAATGRVLRRTVTALAAVHRARSQSLCFTGRIQRSKTMQMQSGSTPSSRTPVGAGLLKDDGERGSEHRRSTWRQQKTLSFMPNHGGQQEEGEGEGEGAAEPGDSSGRRRSSLGQLTSQMAAQAAAVQRAKARYMSEGYASEGSPPPSPR